MQKSIRSRRVYWHSGILLLALFVHKNIQWWKRARARRSCVSGPSKIIWACLVLSGHCCQFLTERSIFQRGVYTAGTGAGFLGTGKPSPPFS